MIHHSAKEKFRAPLGAVAAGTKVRLGLEVRNIPHSQVYLVVLDNGRQDFVEMRCEDGVFYAEYTVPASPCVLWYWFCIRLTDGAKIYYGAQRGMGSGVGKAYPDVPPAFQLTVFDPLFQTPDWLKNANLYQIFPDRFCRREDGTMQTGISYHRALGREVFVHEKWEEPPLYAPLAGHEYYSPCDYYGGNLGGITDSLDYLQEMGITALYLNPISEAASNHRYNTGDYLNADPILGGNAAFAELAEQAAKRGIRIVLDGVYSHTGDDSMYFNKYGRYASIGAYQSKDSPYYPWYRFTEYPEEYQSWWGFRTLPEVEETQPEWIDYVISGTESVLHTWLARGAAGYRLDVADELPDETIAQMRCEIKKDSIENALIGEVWEDATTKQSYGINRTYALGRGLDSVMNYPFANAVIRFLNKDGDADEFLSFLLAQSQNYPKEMYFSLMNLLSSHDVARIRTVLGTKIDAHTLSREQQAHFVVTEEQDRAGARLQRLAAALQFVLPGMPCVYYGDETGMNGLLDPFNREPYTSSDKGMEEYYRFLAKMRLNTDALRTGDYMFFHFGKDVIGVLRYCLHEKDAFGKPAQNGIYLALINRGITAATIVADFWGRTGFLPLGQENGFLDMDFTGAKCLLTGNQYEMNEGLLEVEIPEEDIRILEIEWI
ncbi:MAG: glycoside hydrolase family 13 protein [Christensenella sp.]|nr:glycoside hydrolase family 13 protein [Christensenella sp.]